MNAADARIGAAVRAEMARQRKRQTDLAAVLELTQQAVSRRLNGEVPLTGAELESIGRYLGVSPAAFFGPALSQS